jgi:hypothetical protein
MSCTASCKTKDHDSYAQCLRQNMPMIDGGATPTRTNASMNGIKKDEKELTSYYDALRQGVEPISTKKKDIDNAMAVSNEVGRAFDGNTMGFKG